MRALFATILFIAALASASSTAAAVKPKPYQWTAATAAREMPRSGFDALGRGTLTITRCTGTGKPVAKRWTAFKCSAIFKPRAIRDPEQRATLFVRVRKVGKGQACVSAVSFAKIQAGCLNPKGSRVAGSSDDALSALRAKLAEIQGSSFPYQGPTECVGFGASYFECWFGTNENGPEAGLASVILLAAGPVVTVSRMTP